MRLPGRKLTVTAAAAVTALAVAFASTSGDLGDAPPSPAPTTTAVVRPEPTPMLVLYDTGSDANAATAAERNSLLTANLLGHVGPVTRLPVQSYTSGAMAEFGGVVYERTDTADPVPAAFLDDVVAGSTPVVWAGADISPLDVHVPGGLSGAYGFEAGAADARPRTMVRYRGTGFTRDLPDGTAPVVPVTVTDRTRATPLGSVGPGDLPDPASAGDTTVWAVRSGTLTYVGESPYTSMSEDDRYVAWADVLLGAFAPDAPRRHRALVRLDAIGPTSDPTRLRAAIDELVTRRIPFTMAVHPLHLDPEGVRGKRYGSSPQRPALRLAESPDLVEVIQYGLDHGGTIASNGFTHQYSDIANPYAGVSGEDFEMYRATLDPATDDVTLVGPLPDGTRERTAARLGSARQLLAEAGLPLSEVRMFQVPNDVASATDYAAINEVYEEIDGDLPPTRFDRGRYAPTLPDGGVDEAGAVGQFFPYPVIDAYGSLVVPENLGRIAEAVPGREDDGGVRDPAAVVATARRNLAVRDGVAGFAYDPRLGPDRLADTLDGMTALGYEFVASTSITVR